MKLRADVAGYCGPLPARLSAAGGIRPGNLPAIIGPNDGNDSITEDLIRDRPPLLFVLFTLFESGRGECVSGRSKHFRSHLTLSVPGKQVKHAE